MKKYVCAIIFIIFCFSLNAQKTNSSKMEYRITAIEDRNAIKNLVDTFSVLADVKEVDKQLLLFTEDATVESIRNGQPGNVLKGRKQIGDAFKNFLNLFEVVYHINGQQTITLNGNTASGISYCQVTLIGNENGKKISNTMGVIYHDEYVKQNGSWLIAKRQSDFTYTDRRELGQ
ncbi:MAG: nuclear transport factor 2 family protein [Bacteroidia bacterium]|nr:nuclear transport factor 2 family protein [Bacteroidia bacterium]